MAVLRRPPLAHAVRRGLLDYGILRLTDYDGNWRYIADIGPHKSCQGPASGDNLTVSGLSYSATYTYTVYDDDGCDGDAIAATTTFTTLTPLNWLTVSNVQSTTATLNMDSQYTHVSWWHTRMGGSAGERCVKASGGSVNLTGLTDKTFYDYVAYYSPVCLNSHIIDRTYFTTTDSGVGNLTSNLDGGCSFGRRNSTTEQSCAAAFTTGTNPDGGYFLHTVTARLEREVGYTGPVVATLHSADADGKPAPQSLATLSGNTKQAAGAYVFSCEGTGVCNLSPRVLLNSRQYESSGRPPALSLKYSTHPCVNWWSYSSTPLGSGPRSIHLIAGSTTVLRQFGLPGLQERQHHVPIALPLRLQGRATGNKVLVHLST